MHIIKSYWCIRVFRRSKELFDKGYTAYFHVNGTGKKKILMLAKCKGFTPADTDTNIAFTQVEL